MRERRLIFPTLGFLKPEQHFIPDRVVCRCQSVVKNLCLGDGVLMICRGVWYRGVDWKLG